MEEEQYIVPAYVARDKDGVLWLCYDKPSKNEYLEIWDASSDIATQIPSKFYPDVKWEDDEPMEIEVIIKTK